MIENSHSVEGSQAQKFKSLSVLDHPLIRHKLSLMRKTETKTPEFKRLLREIALLMGYEVTRLLPTFETEVQTPMARMQTHMVDEESVVIVPILRAGLGMAEGLHELIPSAREGHIGMYRDSKTQRPVEYLLKLPSAEERIFILVDPMLATGYSAAHAVDALNRHGVPDDRILFLALVAAPEGVQVLQDTHPTVRIFTAALDHKLNEKAYIIPGLGDAGDRLFGTV